MLFTDDTLTKGFCFFPAEAGGSGVAHREFDESKTGDSEDEGGLSDEDVGAADEGPEDDETEEGGDLGSGESDDSLASRVAEKATPDLSSVWEQHGISGLPNDPQAIAQAYQQYGQMQSRVNELQQQLLWQAHNYRQQQEMAQRPPAEKPKPLFELPEFNREWLNMVTTDEHGNVIAKPGADPSLPQKINAYAKAREQYLDKFLSDPIGTLQQGLAPVIQQTANQIAEQRVRELRLEQGLRQFERENASWVFVNGKGGAITPAAQTFNRYFQEALQMGVQDPIAYAERGINAELAPILIEQQATAAQKQAAAANNKNQDREFIKAAASKQANRTGGQPNGTTRKSKPRADGQFPRAKLLQAFKNLPDSDFENV